MSNKIENKVMLQIRKGTKKDIEQICKLLIKTWEECYADFIPSNFLNNLSLERQIQRHTKYMSGLAIYYIAENDKKEIIGFASYGKNRKETIQCEQELYTIYVNRDVQGTGIGKQLLTSVFEEFKAGDDIVVSVFKDNPFKSFYAKNGFKKIDEELIDMGDFNLTAEIYLKNI